MEHQQRYQQANRTYSVLAGVGVLLCAFVFVLLAVDPKQVPTSGSVDTFSQLPVLGPHLPPLEAESSIEYSKVRQRGYSDVLCACWVSEEVAMRVLKHLDIEASGVALHTDPQGVAICNGLLHERVTQVSEAKRLWKGEFSEGDILFYGGSEHMGNIVFAFRKKDNWLMIRAFLARE